MTKKIPKKIPWAKPFLGIEEQKLLKRALLTTRISHGPYVEEFEKRFARLHKKKFCITTSSGTSAIHLALLALNIKPNDEVIISGFGFMAAANMVLSLQAKPVFVDIDPKTWCIDPQQIQQGITKKTKAIIVVHPYGNVGDMKVIKQIADKHKLFLIEDSAQAFLSKYLGKLAGTFGDVGCFSFQATKTISMGEGGCVVTDDKNLQERMQLIRDHGMKSKKRYWHTVIGHNFRLTNLQAAIGVAALNKLKTITASKKRIYEQYQRELDGQEGVIFQQFKKEVGPLVWCVAISISPEKFGCSRDTLIKRLERRGIETRPGFYPASLMPLYKLSILPVAEEVSKDVISLPSFVEIKNEEIKYICDCLISLKKNK